MKTRAHTRPCVDVGEWLQRTHQTTHFAGRQIAKTWRDAVEVQLSQVGGVEVLTLDFAGVEIFDYTAADEGVVKLVRRRNMGEYGEVALALACTTSSHERNLTVALERARLAIVVQRKDGPEILGHVHPYLRQMFAAVVSAQAMTARDWVDATGTRLSLASTTLLNLYKLGLVLRATERLPGGGLQYVYSPVEARFVLSNHRRRAIQGHQLVQVHPPTCLAGVATREDAQNAPTVLDGR